MGVKTSQRSDGGETVGFVCALGLRADWAVMTERE